MRKSAWNNMLSMAQKPKSIPDNKNENIEQVFSKNVSFLFMVSG